jgi:hypothetical protein
VYNNHTSWLTIVGPSFGLYPYLQPVNAESRTLKQDVCVLHTAPTPVMEDSVYEGCLLKPSAIVKIEVT